MPQLCAGYPILCLENKENSRQIFQNIENDRSIGAEFVV